MRHVTVVVMVIQLIITIQHLNLTLDSIMKTNQELSINKHRTSSYLIHQ